MSSCYFRLDIKYVIWSEFIRPWPLIYLFKILLSLIKMTNVDWWLLAGLPLDQFVVISSHHMWTGGGGRGAAPLRSQVMRLIRALLHVVTASCRVITFVSV